MSIRPLGPADPGTHIDGPPPSTPLLAPSPAPAFEMPALDLGAAHTEVESMIGRAVSSTTPVSGAGSPPPGGAPKGT